jgi:rhodanese-related sulfurtransferase
MTRRTINRSLALLAGVCAAAALVAGDPPDPNANTIDAVTLAGWIRERRPALRILDVRTRSEFEQFNIPTAQHTPEDSLPVLTAEESQTIVLYGNDQADAVRAAAHIRGAGDVLVLRGGIRAWLADIMHPVLPAQATPEQEQLYQRQRELAEYFGGEASRYAEPAASGVTTQQLIQRLKRRTC